MNYKALEQMIQTGDMSRCIGVLENYCLVQNISDAVKQYDPKQHAVTDPTKRRDKEVKGEDDRTTDIVYVSRLPIPIQKKIVLSAVSFLGTPALAATPQEGAEEKMMAAIEKTYEGNKLDYRFRALAKIVMSQKEAAELWFMKDVEGEYWSSTGIKGKFKLGMKVLSRSSGDTLLPVFDEYGDMIAFGRKYKQKNDQQKEIEHFDLYTAEKIYFTKNENGAWQFKTEKGEYITDVVALPNIIKKIPVIYYHQPLTEWEDVQPLIERLETITSNHADTNDYFDSPVVKAKGSITGWTEKGVSGKVLEMDTEADVEYLTWDSLPESKKLEIDNLLKYIYSFTHTPDISFEQMKGLGVFSGIALKMLFMDAHLKAADKEEMFGECLQRRLNFMKAALAKIDTSLSRATSLGVKPVFKYYVPNDYVEEIDSLVKSLNAGMISKETAVKMNPLVNDPASEMEAIANQGAVNVNDTTAQILKALNSLSPLVANKVLESLTEEEIRSLVSLGKKIEAKSEAPAEPIGGNI